MASPPDACPLCGASMTLALQAPDRRFDGQSSYAVWRCGRCGLGWTRLPENPTPAHTPYPASYAPYHQTSRPAFGLRGRLAATLLAAQGYPQPQALPLPRPLAQGLAAIRCWTWCPPPPPPGKLLDVGCGSGAYGVSVQRLGWEVVGIEPDDGAAARARQAGLKVWQGEVLKVNLPEAAFDAITLWHVLEHVAEPVAALRWLRPALRPGGALLAETPNWAGLGARLAGSYWFHLDIPRHRYHFTPHSLRLALEQAGYRVLRLQHIPNPHGFAGSLAYRAGRKRLRQAATLQALGWAFGVISAGLRRADVIRVTATPLARP